MELRVEQALTGRGLTVRIGDGRTRVMGIVNVTPDSFFDGGEHSTRDLAVEHAFRLERQGAEVLDIGGESTRPGAEEVSAADEIDRVVPVIEQLAGVVKVPISVDTTKAEVAEAALRAGAHWINDVSAGVLDPEILEVAAAWDVPYVAMHMRGTPRTMQQDTHYDDLLGEIVDYFKRRLEVMRSAGMNPARVILDPGIGFGKSREDNYILLGRTEQLRVLDRPLLVGPSRKSFLAAVGGDSPQGRLPGTLAAVTACALSGVEFVRVHDVAEAVQAVAVADRIRRARADVVAG